MNNLTLVYGGNAYGGNSISKRSFDEKHKENSSIVLYDQVFSELDLKEIADLSQGDLFLKCIFINCTGLEEVRMHDCKVIKT